MSRLLARVSEVRRAWLLRDGADWELVFEARPGTELAVGSHIADRLQRELGNVSAHAPRRVVFLSGPTIVARRTGGATPFYVHDAATPDGRTDRPNVTVLSLASGQ